MYLTVRTVLQKATTQACSKPTKKRLKECKNIWCFEQLGTTCKF